MLRKCICMIVTVALVVCVSVAPVGAVDADAYFTAACRSNTSTANFTFEIPRYGRKDTLGTFTTGVLSSGSWILMQSAELSVPEASPYPSGSVGIYLSHAFSTASEGSWSTTIGTGFNCTYSLGNTSSFTVPVEVEEFNFSSGVSGQKVSPGIALSVQLDDIDALTAFSFVQAPDVGSGVIFYNGTGSFNVDFHFYVPSVSVVYTESAADLDALESVADQIAEGNEIARAMYGDIMKALNALKDDTALMASYINDCLIYLNSIETATVGTYNLVASYLHNLADIAQTAEDIEAELDAFHTDFMSKLDLLIGTITSESDDIQATMDRIYAQLIAWLETNFKEAISPEFEGSNSDLSQGIANNDAIEQEWTGSLSDTWTAMHIADFSFDPSFTSGFMWVSGWFSNIYNSLGLYGSIVILPLIIGICKLLLGYFRFAGHGHSKGGGDLDA